MKHIKTYEEIDNTKLIPNNIYLYTDIPAVFLGYDNIHTEYPLSCILLPYKNIDTVSGIQWLSNLKLTPCNINIKDYLMKNPHLVQYFLNYLANPLRLYNFGKQKALILRSQLLEDDDIKILLNANKYNL